MSKWLPTNKWIAAQAVLATALTNQAFDHGWHKADSKAAAAFAIEMVVSYFTSNNRLPNADS